MKAILRSAPSGNRSLRESLYQGEIFQLGPTQASNKLVEETLGLLRAELGEDVDLRIAQGCYNPEEFFRRMGRVRRILYLEARFHETVREVMSACGFDPSRIAFDPLRLRIVAHLGHLNPKAAPVYYAHRDTWYAHPQAMINWWIPLHDTSAEETFLFYPDYFKKPVANGSARFEYSSWVSGGWGLKIGWQDPRAGITTDYPAAQEEVASPPLEFSSSRGENLLFSGAHFHRTRPHHSGRTRFSLDFRLVQLDDLAEGLGAPNVDNGSRGSALIDYVRPA